MPTQWLGCRTWARSNYSPASTRKRNRCSLEIQSRRVGYDNSDTLNTSDSLAELYIEQYRYAEARVLLAKGLESYRRLYGAAHPYTSREMYGLGKVLQGEGNYPEAEKVFAEALATEQRARGPRHPDTLGTAEHLAIVYIEEGKVAQGVALLESSCHDFREILGPGHWDTAKCGVYLGWGYYSQGDLLRAERNWRASLQAFQALGKDAEDEAANAGELLGLDMVEQRKYAEAEPLLRESLAYREKANADQWYLFRAQVFVGAALSGQQKFPEAEKLLLSGQQGLEARMARMPADQKIWLRFSEQKLVDLYSTWGKTEEAARWGTKLQGT
jgi:hypothetical protein